MNVNNVFRKLIYRSRSFKKVIFVYTKTIIVDRLTYYKTRIASLEVQLSNQKRIYRNYSLTRLLLFLAIVLSFYFFWGQIILIPVFIVSFGLFLWIVGKSVDAKLKRDKLDLLVQFNKNEIDVIQGDWSKNDDGSVFVNGAHAYATDIDLFGPKSIYQLINRTTSNAGKLALSALFLKGDKHPQINEACISVLEENIEWCQDFALESKGRNKEEKERVKSLVELEHLEVYWTKSKSIMKWIIPVIAFTNVMLYSFSLINGFVFTLLLIGPLSIIMRDLKMSNFLSSELSLQAGRVQTMIAQLHLLEKLKSTDETFNKEINEITSGSTNVLESLKTLNLINKRFEFRMNILVGFVLNYFLAWDFQLQLQLKNWLEKNRTHLEEWESNMGKIECWISGAIFKYNNPDSVFNQPKEVSSIELVGLGHPFVSVNKRVTNDFQLSEQSSFLIITGPNMAGKSTYLRSVGLAIVLANAGFPIIAKKVSIPKMKLYTSMRTSDDLNIESSYFFAELKRLRFIMDAIEKGEKVFIVLDEILKGTNSKDKAIGSAKFLEKLQRLGAKGIIATHDLSLCELADKSDKYENWYFDSTISGNEISFDYKINRGICQNMNASFLLKKMELVD